MRVRNVIWLPTVKEKLRKFRNVRYTPEETLDFISSFILETEDILENNIIGKTYTEEFGKYKDITRIVVRKFRVYYKLVKNDIVILAILFPGEK